MHCNLIFEHHEDSVNLFWPYIDIVRPFSLIYYVVEGEATYKIYGQTYRFKPKHIYIFPANTTLSLINNLSPNFRIMFIHAQLVPEITNLIEVDVEGDSFLEDIIALTRKNIFLKDKARIKLLCELIVSYIIENYHTNSSSICENIRRYIQEHYVEVYRNSDLSKIFSYSNSHILKIYKDNYNTTPRHHALSFLLENIISRLEEGEPIYKISDSLEFSSPENFSKFFKKHLGASPSHFLKKHQSGKRS